MKKTTYCCDKCGEEIPDVVYVLSCYAYSAEPGNSAAHFGELNDQNTRQNAAMAGGVDRHLCRKCKDKITDGIFIL
jgi:hypothetical protein